ncbi:MAG: DUF2304 domain-containing protein [Candidatus Flexifilum sp.]
MIDRITIFGLGGSILALVFVLELVRRRKLREDYSLLWLATAIVLIVISAYRPLLDALAGLLNIVTYPPAALFAVAVVFMLFILLQYSLALTRLSQENKTLAQQLALLRWELIETQRRIAASADADADQPGDDQDQQQ